MSTDLDPEIAARFAELDRVPVPDTWSRIARPASPVRSAPARAPHRRWLAVAAALLIVAGVGAITLAVTSDDADAPTVNPQPATTDAMAPTTTLAGAPSSTASSPASTLAAPGSLFGTATITPSSLRPGDAFTLTPTAVVPRPCETRGTLFATRGQLLAIGLVENEPGRLRRDLRRNDCGMDPSSAAERYVVPSDLTTGDYVVCIDELVAAGCGTIRVTVPAAPGAAPTDDLIAGWSLQGRPTTGATLGDVPRLMPGVVTAAEMRPEYRRRSGWADDATPQASYVQTWVDEVDPGRLLRITTTPGQHIDPRLPAGEPIDLAPWDRAEYRRTVGGVVSLDLDDPAGTVQVWAAGLTRDEVTGLVRSLRPRGTVPGWALAPDTTLFALHEGWSGAFAIRTLTWVSPGGEVVAEVSIQRGNPSAFADLVGSSGTSTLSGIGASPALLYAETGRTAVVFSPSAGVTVIVAYGGRDANAAMAIATSLAEVSAAEWDAIPIQEGDGCNSMFC